MLALGPQLGLGLWFGFGLVWVFGCDGTDEIYSSLLVHDLNCGIVLVCSHIELLYLSVLKFAL